MCRYEQRDGRVAAFQVAGEDGGDGYGDDAAALISISLLVASLSLYARNGYAYIRSSLKYPLHNMPTSCTLLLLM
jgi:hypothetical protein